MKNIEVIITLPLAIIGLLSLMVIDLVRVTQGQPTVDEEWHSDYVNGNLNQGQGEEKR